MITHSFEKKTCPNLVIQRETALAADSVRSTLMQEVIRRLLNCSLDLDLPEKHTILSTFAQKMLNSGHSIESTRIVPVHAVVKFLDMVRMSELPTDDSGHRPLHFEKNYMRV